MINLFQVASSDASLGYLAQIFGNVSGVISLGGGQSVTLLSTMFKTFNSVILTVAVLMLVYVTILAAIGTAHDGEFMGKKMNNIWIPIRAVLGIALLVPTTAGYCAIQILMMWVIVQGVGAADTLWNTALGYVSAAGSPYVQGSVPNVGTSQVFTGLFQGLVCDASSKQADPLNLGNYYCATRGGCGGSAPTFNPEAGTYTMGPNGACGSITYCKLSSSCKDSSSMSCAACQSQTAALASIIPTFAAIAQALVTTDYSYRDFYANSWNNTDNASWNWIYDYCASTTNADGSTKTAIPKDQCCVKGINPMASCQASSSSALPPANTQTGAGGSFQSPSTEAVKNVYFPYSTTLQSYLSGDGADFIQAASDQYQTSANAAMSQFVSAQTNSPKQLSDALSSAASKGWIAAGGLYYNIANMNSNNLKSAKVDFNWNAPDVSSSAMSQYRNDVSAASTLAAAAGGNFAGASGVAGNTQAQLNQVTDSVQQSLADTMNSTFSSTISSASSSVSTATSSGGSNPLVGLQAAGTSLLITAEVTFTVVMVMLTIAGTVAGINGWALGTGLFDPAMTGVQQMAMFVIPALYGLLFFLVTTGALLAIYTPLIPYIFFTFGAIGWIISAIEAMVAGPLVAIGIISPSGQHEILGKAEPALMLLFNVFLRPSLMIFGLMAAMLLAVVVVQMINSTFFVVWKSFTSSGAGADPLSAIFMLVAYVLLLLAALNKAFAVINIIPQRAMAWISHHSEGVDVPQEIKSGMDSAGSRAGQGMENKAQGTQKDAAAGAKKRTKQDQKDKAEAAGGGVGGTSSGTSSGGGAGNPPEQ